jgi:general secretion pathway protein E/type IV pilus assembly protein PilB
MATIRIGDLLKEKQLITDEHITYALQVQKVTKQKLGSVLTSIGLVSEYDLAECLAGQLGLPHVDLNKELPDLDILKKFNRNTCQSQRIFPLYRKDNVLIVATSDLPDTRLEQTVLRTMGLKPSFVISEESKLISAIYNYFYFLTNPVENLIQRETETLRADASLTVSPDNFITLMLLLAIKKRATDVHIRPMLQGIGISFRVDGVLISQMVLDPSLSRIITAIKLMAGMDISEQRRPQDGRWSVNLLERRYDIRVSSIVTPFGENLVLRLLSQERVSFSLTELGFLHDDVQKIEKFFAEPYGLILLTGPTGSGKSTTLVAGLMTLDLLGKNVLTVENPIEYIVPLARQTQVNIAAGYDFADAMPSFLRHDPDVIMVGEMRDEKTARTAVIAATTGHLVLSTLHSNTSIGAIPRLRGLSLDNLMIAESLIAIVSQRLVRSICPHCAEKYVPSKEELAYLGTDVDTLYRGKGCEFCNNTGYFGRTLVYEALPMTPELRLALGKENTDIYNLERIAREDGFQSMFEVGVHKVLAGLTTVDELQRVLGLHRYVG